MDLKLSALSIAFFCGVNTKVFLNIFILEILYHIHPPISTFKIPISPFAKAPKESKVSYGAGALFDEIAEEMI